MSLKVMSSNMQLSRIAKELEHLEQSEEYLIKQVAKPIGQQIFIEVNKIGFRITLTKNYPYCAPILECVTVNCFPSISDGRNLLEDIFQGTWSPVISLYEIATQLPLFIKSKRLNDNVGRFDLYGPLDFSEWNKRPDMGYFFCQEIDDEMRTIEERICLVSHSHLIVLQIDPHIIDLGYIIYFMPFNCIHSVRVKKEDPNIVAVSSKNNKGEYLLLRIGKSKEMVQLFLQNSNMLKVINSKSAEEEGIFTNFCIYSYIERVQDLEKLIKNQKNPVAIKEMLKLYQMIIEYFSAASDKRFEYFLQKSQELFLII